MRVLGLVVICAAFGPVLSAQETGGQAMGAPETGEAAPIGLENAPPSVDGHSPEESAAQEPAPAEPTPDLAPSLFCAVAADDPAAVAQLLDAGADVNASLPKPAPEDLLRRFRGTHLEFYVTKEEGLTPLMLASAMGHTDVVRLLIARGAERHAVTRPHKTFALWLAGRAGHVEAMQLLLGVSPESDAGRMKIRISLADQTAYLWKDGVVVRAMPISSGRAKYPTRKGKFVVTDKYRDWRSTLYPARMPYFLRLSCMDFGLHAGALPGYPASHGCIRLPAEDAKALFTEVPVGTLVEIE